MMIGMVRRTHPFRSPRSVAVSLRARPPSARHVFATMASWPRPLPSNARTCPPDRCRASPRPNASSPGPRRWTPSGWRAGRPRSRPGRSSVRRSGGRSTWRSGAWTSRPSKAPTPSARSSALCAKAVRPDPLRPEVPSVAAVCLYPQLVPVAVEQLRGTGVAVASVAGGFPSGLGPLDARLQEIRDVAAAGADEIDIVLNRSLFLGGRYAEAFDELVAAREAAGSTHLKVILETGELGSYDRVRQASMLAMAAGADFIKTSTGKIGVNATLPVALCMLEAVARLPRSDRARGRRQGRRRRPARPSRRSSTWCWCTRRSAPRGCARSGSASGPPAC